MISISGWRFATTSPMIRAGTPRDSIAASACLRFRRDCREKAARRLRIEEQRAKFVGDTDGEVDATLDEFAIVLHAAGEKAALRDASMAPGR